MIRKATINDLDCIAGFQIAMAEETEKISLDKETVLKGVKKVLTDETKGQYYVAEIDGAVVSSLLTTYEWSDWRNGTILWIQSVYVLPAFRRKGIYRKMYNHLKNLVLANDQLNGIRLYADKNNEAAQKTYLKLGMNMDHYVTFEWLK